MLIAQIQAHYPQNTQTYMKTAEKKKRNVFSFFSYCAKKIAKLRPHQMTGASQRASQRASRAVARERQNQIK